MLLYEKYTPYSLNAIVGNKESVEKIKIFGNEVISGKRPKPLLLYGPSGTGKTTAANALANTFGFGIILLTASDYRDAETLRKKILPSATSMGLFSKVTLIVFDEIDELSSQFDKGAQEAILQLLKESRQPILFIATDYWDQRIAFLRGYVDPVEFKRLSFYEVFGFIKEIARKEKMEISEEVLKRIAEQSNGDMRAALNDLEFVAAGKEDVFENLGFRDQKQEIFQVLDSIFYARSFSRAKEAFDSSDIDFDLLIKWIDENVPKRYKQPKAIADAYSWLGLASFFDNLAGKLDYYALLKYSFLFASSGVSLSSQGYVSRLSNYSFPKQVKYLSSTRKERQQLDAIIEKLKLYMHESKKTIRIDFLPLLLASLRELASKKGEENAIQKLTQLGLSEEEARFLLKAKL